MMQVFGIQCQQVSARSNHRRHDTCASVLFLMVSIDHKMFENLHSGTVIVIMSQIPKSRGDQSGVERRGAGRSSSAVRRQ